MRKNTLFIALLCLLSLFGNAQKKPDQIGGRKDKNGCVRAAGYQWSELKKECIRAFELPVQLFDAEKKWNASFIVDQTGLKAEVFCKEGHFILTKNEEGCFEFKKRKKQVKLCKKDNLWTLKCNRVEYFGYLN
jgi:hypothetical protein